MSLTKDERKDLIQLKRKIRGTPIKISLIKGTSNISIHSRYFSTIYKQLGGNASSKIIDAQKRVLKKRKRRMIMQK